MTRVHRRHAQPRASGTVGPVQHRRVEPQRKSSYKVVLEEVTGKKKLKTLVSWAARITQYILARELLTAKKLSFQAEAPPGYMFIPAGDPQLTSRCKKIAKDEQLTVFIVSVSHSFS